MPLYIAYCPDYPDSLERRLKVREEHLEEARKDKAMVFGRAFVSQEYATTATSGGPKHTGDTPNPGMAGSVMHFKMANIDDVWARLKRDKYWVGKVWDQDRVSVHEFIKGPGDDE